MECKADRGRQGLTLGVLIFTVALSGCSGSDTSASQPSSSSNAAAMALVALSAPTYTIAPTSNAVVTIERAGASGAATVGYVTVDGTATAGTDYVATSGSLTWKDGDGDAKTVTVPLTCEASGKHFAFTLTSVVGDANYGSPTTATIEVSAR